MRNILKYKSYTGSVHFDAGDKVFHGRILGLTDVIGFEGISVDELEKDFHEAVDDYLEAKRQQKSINALISEICEKAVGFH